MRVLGARHVQAIEHNSLIFYRSERWASLTHGIFTRHGGTSAAPFDSLNLGGNVGDDPRHVRANHELMYAALGVADERTCSVWQVHGSDVVIANTPVSGRRWLTQADAMVTDRVGIPLSMRFADCTPLLFLDAVQGVIGIAHAGWRGTVLGVGARVVETLTQTYGSKPQNIQALIGPSIGPERYQVGEEVVAAFERAFGATKGIIRRDPSDGTAYLNLWAANAITLRRAGVEDIEIAELCTATRTDLFFSHRAERGNTGRFGAVISL
jgi:YfiH family protein